jgi:phenylpropionate dioxygenase-like ring-hydroxylating dioxygenase large terminal subunit
MPDDVEAILWDDWHVIAERTTITLTGRLGTALFGRALIVVRDGDGIAVFHGTRALPVRVHYDLVWTTLGTPAHEPLVLAEAGEMGRSIAPVGSLGIAVSGLRAVENFLDLGHLAFVHPGWIGDASSTAVAPYQVESTDEGLRMTGVRVYQPHASPTASGGMQIDYTYTVHRPYTASLTKTNPLNPSRHDALALFVQPVDEDHCVLHMLNLYLTDGDADQAARRFTRHIESQDKPILENQRPTRLPLDPRAELPVRSDACSLAYRRWLCVRGVRYGAIPASVA